MITANKKYLGVVFLTVFHALSAVSQQPATLVINFERLETPTGFIRLALYFSEEDFMQEEKAVLHSFPVVSGESLTVTIEGLMPTPMAFAAFHDENGNRKLDTNLFGIPTEPYGFSRPCPSKWRPPCFGEAKMVLRKGENKVSVPLLKWKL